jgi:osmoprotectant transport system permease protein
MVRSFAAVSLLVATCLAAGPVAAGEHVVVGSKAFPESWILSEAAVLLARRAGASAEHAMNLGGTEIAFAALKSGQIDMYPEYTGTIARVILHDTREEGIDALRHSLLPLGIAVSPPLGFNDGYALATRSRNAEGGDLLTISSLATRGDLRFGLTHEFLGRPDGYPGLAARYGLAPTNVRGMQHELALQALLRGDLDVVDVYTTDAQVGRMGLRILEDDRHFFPRYDAVLLYGSSLPQRAPRALEAILELAGHVGEPQMRRANEDLVLDHASVDEAAHGLLRDALAIDGPAPASRSIVGEIARDTLRHIELVTGSVLASVLMGVPLGILATRSRILALVTTSFSEVLQTVPSLALLALLVPMLGIGATTALTALFLYGLLPIVRATHVGIATIPPAIVESAEAIGLSPSARLGRVLLPIASPHILAGIRTSTTLAVGTATIAALIGAGGLGEPILQGINLQDTPRVLEGAVPAAALALLVDAVLAAVGWRTIPRGLRAGRQKAR